MRDAHDIPNAINRSILKRARMEDLNKTNCERQSNQMAETDDEAMKIDYPKQPSDAEELNK